MNGQTNRQRQALRPALMTDSDEKWWTDDQIASVAQVPDLPLDDIRYDIEYLVLRRRALEAMRALDAAIKKKDEVAVGLLRPLAMAIWRERQELLDSDSESLRLAIEMFWPEEGFADDEEAIQRAERRLRDRSWCATTDG